MIGKPISARVVLAASVLGLLASCFIGGALICPFGASRLQALPRQLKRLRVRRLVLGAGASILVLGACTSVSFVDELSIVNATEYSPSVEVTGEDRDGWLALRVVEPQSTTAVEDVIDQGEVWIFRFDYLGKYQEEVEVSGSELAQSDWSVEVPQSFEQSLRDMGVPPPP